MFLHLDKEISGLKNFQAENLSGQVLEGITLLSRKVRRDILTMIDHAGSGHVGGSLSSADIYLMLWLCADVSVENCRDDNRDRIIVSHGHTSAGLYSVLGNFGFFDLQEAIRTFRRDNTVFEGHPNSRLPGVEWCSGSLGQGLSVGCGFALASKLRKFNNRVFVVMGDGEQQKGQLTEAREFATKHHLHNLTAIVDVNRLQSSGTTEQVMPGNLQKKYKAAGWEVLSIDGHDFQEIYQALKYSHPEKPVAILANTVMGKGVQCIENNYEYHGKLLSKEQYEEAIAGLGGGDSFTYTKSTCGLPLSIQEDRGGAELVEVRGESEEDKLAENVKFPIPVETRRPEPVEGQITPGTPIVYPAGKPVECRTAAGEAIYNLIKTNAELPVVVVDCDLVESLKNGKVQSEFPEKFIECGIQEHNAATVSGALSKAGVLPFFMDFGVFGIDETYGQHRMNAVNDTSVKVIASHCGLDVGEDGKTHQCIDYIALMANLPGYKLIIPADANQTDRAIRFIATSTGNFVVAMGRSKVPVLIDKNGDPLYGGNDSFFFGRAEWAREGTDAVIISTGTLVHIAVQASDTISSENMKVGVLNISCPGEINVKDIRKACSTGTVVTYEDHLVQSGMGSLVASVIAENGLSCRFKKMGITKYGKSCSAGEQYKYQGLDPENLIKVIRELKTM